MASPLVGVATAFMARTTVPQRSGKSSKIELSILIEMNTFVSLIQILSIIAPLLFAGLGLVAALKMNVLKSLDKPLDHGLKIKGVRIFGDNKTYRGVLILTALSIICVTFLNAARSTGNEYVHPLFSYPPLTIGILYAMAYTLGELINSFIKRQLHIRPGVINQKQRRIQVFFDLSDGIILVAISLILFTTVPTAQIILAACIGVGVHHLIDMLMLRLELKQEI